MAADSQREIDAAQRMSESELSLQPDQRDLVEKTIADHCQHRGWHLHAVNCRTQHVHVVTALGYEPDDVMNQFKTWCTRRLKELATKANQPVRARYWTRLGSKRKIFDEDGLAAAIVYVVEGQDGPR
jgi:REP element-mobilizing transposase RayT